MDLSHHRAAIAQSLEALDRSLEDLVNSLGHSDAACVLKEPGSAMRLACEAYVAINYGMEDQVNSSIVCLGAIAAAGDLIKKAKAVNAHKAEFKAACTTLAGHRIRVPAKVAGSPTQAIPAIRVVLRNIQRSDINLLAAYRKIPILAAPPISITFTRANTRAVYRKSVEELFTMLSTAEGPKASADRAMLSTLSPKETHLALVMDRYQNVRANVLYSRLDSRGRGRVQIPAELPILHPIGANEPEIRFPELEEAPTEPAHVREGMIEEKPFLQTIAAYRYRIASRR